MPYLNATILAAALAAAAWTITPAAAQTTPQGRAAPGTAPGPPATPSQTFPATPSQTFSESTIAKTGAAVRSIAGVRQRHMERLDATEAPEARRSIEQDAMKEAVQAIEAEGLTIEEYNDVLRAAQSDMQLRERLIAAVQSPRR
jgi:hypothetical protein